MLIIASFWFQKCWVLTFLVPFSEHPTSLAAIIRTLLYGSHPQIISASHCLGFSFLCGYGVCVRVCVRMHACMHVCVHACVLLHVC